MRETRNGVLGALGLAGLFVLGVEVEEVAIVGLLVCWLAVIAGAVSFGLHTMRLRAVHRGRTEKITVDRPVLQRCAGLCPRCDAPLGLCGPGACVRRGAA